MKKAIVFLVVLCLMGVYVSAQGTLQFNQVKLIGTSAETVPAGKVWKVVNAFSPTGPKFQASSGSGGCTGSCNGSTTLWTSFTLTVGGCPPANSPQVKINGNDVNFNPIAPLWLPAGNTVAGTTVSCPQSAGFFSGQGYSCYCPTTSFSFTVNVIEFNIIP